MFEKIKTLNLVASTTIGMNRVYGNLDSDGVAGISKAEVTANIQKLIGLDMPFAQLIENGFSKADVNKDGILSPEEYQALLSSFSKGYTADQLAILSEQSVGTSTKSLMDTVMANFHEIDKNKDGLVSQDEIKIYFADKEVDEKKADINALFDDNLSIFYSGKSETSSEESNSDSISTDF